MTAQERRAIRKVIKDCAYTIDDSSTEEYRLVWETCRKTFADKLRFVMNSPPRELIRYAGPAQQGD